MFEKLDTCFNLLPIAFFLFFWKKSKSENSIWCITVYSFLYFAVGLLLWTWKKVPLLYDFCTFFEFWCFTAFFHSQLQNVFSKKLLRLNVLSFTLLYILFLVYTKNTPSVDKNTIKFDSIAIGVEMLLLLPFCFYYLYERTNDTTTLFIYNIYQFWIVLGIVLYLAGTFFIYIFATSLSLHELEKYWVVTNLFSILRSCLFSLAIFYYAKPPKNNTLTTDFEVSYFN